MRRTIACGALLLAGCVTGPRPAPPAGPAIPSGWTEPAGTARVEAGWWNRFGDPVLSGIVARALAGNTDIALAASRIDAARAAERSARASLFPSVSAGVQAAESRSVSGIGTPLNQFAVGPQLSVAYEADLFGRGAATRQAARLDTTAATAARDATALTVAATAASSYLTLRALDARLQTARETLASRAQALHFARRRAETGYTSQLEFNQAEAEYRATAQVIPQTELAIARAEHGLSLLLGGPPGPIPRGLPLDRLVPPPVPGGLPSELLRRRPDIYAAEERIAASDARLRAARAAYLPQIALNGSTGLALSTALVNPITLFSIGGSVLAPLFSGGRLRAGVEAANAARDEAVLTYRGTVLTAFREVDDALAANDRLSAQEAEVSAQRAALAAALRRASERYRAGYSPYLEQLDAQRSLLAADLTLIQTRLDRLTASVDVYRALGGGWTAPAGTAAPPR